MVAMAVGCTKSDDFEQPQLSVSDKEIKFANQVGEKTITVTTNCKEWFATTPKQWVHLTQNGNEIIVKVDANTSGAERSSHILVDGGLAVEKIMVNQSAADVSLNIANGELVLPQAGGATTGAGKNHCINVFSFFNLIQCMIKVGQHLGAERI